MKKELELNGKQWNDDVTVKFDFDKYTMTIESCKYGEFSHLFDVNSDADIVTLQRLSGTIQELITEYKNR